nr:hypothetical protein [uncultured Fluviicola sp.]
MKTLTSKDSSKPEKTGSKNQASAEVIIQAYKNSNAANSVAQLESYSETVTRSEDITAQDMNDWGTVRTKLGGIAKGKDANSKIAERANSSLEALGLNSGTAMSAHMIPNRIGGAGGAINVRPWDAAFESGTWENSVEKVFNNAVPGDAGGSISYEVETTDMDDEKADEIIEQSSNEDEKAVAKHKDNIKPIPLSVSATVGGVDLPDTDGPIANLIS